MCPVIKVVVDFFYILLHALKLATLGLGLGLSKWRFWLQMTSCLIKMVVQNH